MLANVMALCFFVFFGGGGCSGDLQFLPIFAYGSA